MKRFRTTWEQSTAYDRVRAEIGKHRIGGLTVAVAHDQNGIVLVSGEARLLGLSAAFAGRTADQLARAVGRFKDEGFVGFDDAGHRAGLPIFGCGQEAMAPADRPTDFTTEERVALTCLPQLAVVIGRRFYLLDIRRTLNKYH